MKRHDTAALAIINEKSKERKKEECSVGISTVLHVKIPPVHLVVVVMNFPNPRMDNSSGDAKELKLESIE